VITRDAESERYVIADQSSTNGVRVNGNQYGKVELRAGDYIDLGWVRFRFVAPNELFLFSRDAVVAALPTGRKRRKRRRNARSARRLGRRAARATLDLLSDDDVLESLLGVGFLVDNENNRLLLLDRIKKHRLRRGVKKIKRQIRRSTSKGQ
jgi:hypothetical protein